MAVSSALQSVTGLGSHSGSLWPVELCKPLPTRMIRLEAGVGIELCFQFSYEENIGFPSEDQEEFGVTRHYLSVLCQYFH
jgi:hypothetical protein